MENHHLLWVNQRFLCAMFNSYVTNYQKGNIYLNIGDVIMGDIFISSLENHRIIYISIMGIIMILNCPRIETLIVARELYVKKNFIYDFFYDFNMIKFMIWIFSIFSLWKNMMKFMMKFMFFFFRSGIFMILLWFFNVFLNDCFYDFFMFFFMIFLGMKNLKKNHKIIKTIIKKQKYDFLIFLRFFLMIF